MLINGEWLLGTDKVLRPVIKGEIEVHSGTWTPVPFLLDSGSDATVLSPGTVEDLNLQPASSQQRLEGLGGQIASGIFQVRIRFKKEDGAHVVFNGNFAGLTQPAEALDLSVLGRDITNLFAVIIDRPQETVCLLGQRHSYTIHQK